MNKYIQVIIKRLKEDGNTILTEKDYSYKKQLKALEKNGIKVKVHEGSGLPFRAFKTGSIDNKIYPHLIIELI